MIDKQLQRACACLGIRLVHSRPGQPAGRGKIEKFFRTVREQFLVEIGSGRELDDMTQLNTLFTAWVETVYHRRVHSETGQAPIGPVVGRSRPRHAVDRAAAGGVPLVGVAHRHQDRHRRAARQQLRGRRRPGRPQGRAGVRPVRPHPHRGPLARPLDGPGGAARDRPARARQGPPRRHDATAAGADRDRLPAPGRSTAHRRTGRPGPVRPTARRARAARARARRHVPGQLPLPGIGSDPTTSADGERQVSA